MEHQVPVSTFQSPDVWPPSNCSESLYGSPVLPNTTDSRVCAIQSTNRTLAAACCNGAELQEYLCFLYCRYDGTGGSFQQCYMDQTGVNRISPGSMFCQGNLSSKNTATLTSSGFREYTTPRLSWLVMVVLFALFFVGPTNAKIVPSLDNGKTLAFARRQSSESQCTFEPERNFTKGGRQIKVSDTVVGSNVWGQQVDSGIDNNNRTINGNSAAEPEYDQFFEVVSKATGRLYPAQSSVSTFHEVFGGYTSYLTWIPTQLCFNGTITNCESVLDDSINSTMIEACGPVFVGDVKSLDDVNAIIQGLWWVVYTG